MCGRCLKISLAQAGEQQQRLLQGGCRLLLLLQEGACSNRLLLGFLGVLYEGVEFGFEGGGVSCFGTHVEQGRQRSGPRTAVLAQRLAAAWTVGLRQRS
jgi:hypothetical protein